MNDDAMRMRVVVMPLVGEKLAGFRLEATLHVQSEEPRGQQPQSVHHMVERGGSRCSQDRWEILLTFRPQYT